MDPSLNFDYRHWSNDAARAGRSPEQLCTDYLAFISDHLLYVLRQKLGDDIVRSTPTEWIFTVPAIWSDSAKEKTRAAALKAPAFGGRSLNLVSEPEAAALYTLHHLDPHGLQVGDTIVTVDAGGGTVDLISYTIRKLSPVLALDEAAPGHGGLCGSEFVNERFRKFMKANIGHLTNFNQELMSTAMDVFETKASCSPPTS